MHSAWKFLPLAFALALVAAPAAADDNAKILEWSTMAGVQAPYTGAANPIRGVGGGGAPWSIARGVGVLRADGELDIDVRGLVITTTGVNPSAQFKAIVSCQTNVLDTAGNTVAGVVNVETTPQDVPATGDARIRATVPLPDPCYAPLVFVANAAGRWFAVTGSSGIDGLRIPPPAP